MKKILIVNPFGIGDVLCTRPLIAGLKGLYPSASICYIGNNRTRALLENEPLLDEVFSYERDDFFVVYKRSVFAFLFKWISFVRELRARKFDVAIDCSLGSPLVFALFLAGVPRRVGYDYKGRGRWLTDKILLKGFEGRHVAEYFTELLSLVAGRPVSGVSAGVLWVDHKDEIWRDECLREHCLIPKEYIIVHPGGGASWGTNARLRRWQPENFAKLADKMIEKGSSPIILLGDKSEVALCTQIASRMVHKPLMLAGQANIMQAVALMQAAKLVIVNDGGPLHVAVASGARTVSVFGPVDPFVYGPYPPQDHRIIQKGLACQPCYKNFRTPDCTHQACLRDLSVDEVFNVIMETL